MKPSYALAAAVLLAAAAAGQTPPPAGSAVPQGLPLVVLLADFKVVEGVVERAGAEYVIRRGKDVRRVPEKDLLFAGESHDAVRKFLQARAAQPPANAPADRAAVRQFNSAIQPILSNRCTGCHSNPKTAGGFTLVPVNDQYADPAAVRLNATAAAEFVTPANPAASPLLLKAVTAHGGQHEPVYRNREHPSVQKLLAWASEVAATGPQAAARPPAVIQASATTAAIPVDPFDPAEFNRIAHPPKDRR